MPDLDRSRTPLLALITQEALDRDYQVAASRRTTDHVQPHARGYRIAVLAVVGVFAMLVTVAAVQTSQNSDVDVASRTSLLERIDARRTNTARLQVALAKLRTANAAAEEALRSLGSRYADRRATQARLGAISGFEPVTGAGVRIQLDNPGLAGATDQIRDSDLALLVDGLWAAGAEAVAINGQRVNAHGGITMVGEAIEVNGVGVAAPYTVLAIGDPATLAANFVESQSGLRFRALVERYGFSQKMTNSKELHLPAAPAHLQRLRFAKQKAQPKSKGGMVP